MKRYDLRCSHAVDDAGNDLGTAGAVVPSLWGEYVRASDAESVVRVLSRILFLLDTGATSELRLAQLDAREVLARVGAK